MRRQTPRRTRVELHRALSADGRKWVNETWRAAEGLVTQRSLLSAATTALANRLSDSYAGERPRGDELQRALFDVMKAGYASREVLADPTAQPSLDPSALRLERPFDAERLVNDDGAVTSLIEAVEGIASADFHSVMTLPPDVWSSYTAIATLRLQRDLASDTLTWRELGRERIEGMLRIGYVLRCLDEALDIAPAPPED